MKTDLNKLRRQLGKCPQDGSHSVNEGNYLELLVQLEQSFDRSDELLRDTRTTVAQRWRHWKLFDDSVGEALMFIKRLSNARNMAILMGSSPHDLQRLLASRQTLQVSQFHSSIYTCRRCRCIECDHFTDVNFIFSRALSKSITGG